MRRNEKIVNIFIKLKTVAFLQLKSKSKKVACPAWQMHAPSRFKAVFSPPSGPAPRPRF
jgi:hypothetical protein